MFIGIFTTTLFIYFIFSKEDSMEKEEKILQSIQRWYSPDQVLKGKQLFAINCATCHGYNAEKTKEWKKTLVDGTYPPPPLNGTAHAWHHPYSQLVTIIKKGRSTL